MVDYEFYIGAYHGGAISAEEWTAAEREASATLARYKRMYTITAPTPEAESMAVCAMAEALVFNARAEAGQGGAVSSASIGSVSVSYAGASSVDMTYKGKEKRVYKAMALYLDVYRGVGVC